MASKAIPLAVMILRIFTLAACVASGMLIAFDNYATSNRDYILRFKDVFAFRYVLFISVIGGLYNIIQLRFDMYFVSTQKRLILNGCMPEFDFYADNVVSSILWSAIGAGFGDAVELKKLDKYLIPLLRMLQYSELDNLDEIKTKDNDFYDRAVLSTGILLVGAVCMAVVSFLTSITRASN